MKQREKLDEVLGDICQEYRETALPESLEARLLASARRLNLKQTPHGSQSRIWAWAAVSAVAAGLLLAMAIWKTSLLTRGQNRPLLANAGPAQSGTNQTGQETRLKPDPLLSPGRDSSGPAAVRHVAFSARSKQHRLSGQRKVVETGFVTIPGSEGLPPPTEASIVRIEMKKGDLQQYGFQVPPSSFAELIRADFFLGEDGLPRAVRLVQ